MRRWIFAVTVLLVAALPAHAGPKKLPNIVILLADDMGSGDPSCYNKDSKIPTPNIDRLARQGMRFLDAHTPSAVCSPTRYGLLTGCYCWRSPLKKGVLQGYSPLLIPPGRLTLAALLKQYGYRTAAIGKWHLGLGKGAAADFSKELTPGPNRLGFDFFFGIPASLDMPPYVFVENGRATRAPTEKVAASAMRRNGGAGFWRAGAIAPGFKHADVLPRLTEKAVGFLEQQAKEGTGKPFFLYVALTGPHTPWLPTGKFVGKSRAGPYGDFVAQADASVGAVLEALDRLKLSDDTLVIFTSDNGAHWTAEDIRRWLHRANLFWRGQKADIWEAGHRVPFIARWPGHIPQGRTSSETICLTDMLATCAAVVGAKLPKGAGEDSYNVLPALLGTHKGGPIREATVYHSANGLFGIRQGDWVFVDGLGSGGFTAPQREQPRPGGPAGQLYNLARDPRQEKNVFQENPEEVNRLRALLRRYQEQGYSRPRAGGSAQAPAGASGKQPGLLRSQFLYEKAPFPQCHAATLAESRGTLVAAWFGGTREQHPDVSIWVSRHDGKAWSAPVEVADGVQDAKTRFPCWNPVLFQPKSGPLLLFYKVGPDPKRWWGLVMTSDDGGKSWSKPRRQPDGFLGPTKNPPVQLAEGSLLCPSSTEAHGWRVHFERTDARAEKWARTESVSDGKDFAAIQPALLVHPGGRLQALCRTRRQQIAETWSADGGKTWGKLSATALPNPNSGIAATTLADGRHLLVYNHTARGRTPLNVAVSRDGKAWQAALVLEDQPGEYSYPAVLQTADGLVHIAYTWRRQRIKHVVLDPAKLLPRAIR